MNTFLDDTDEEEEVLREEMLAWTRQTVLFLTSQCHYAIVPETWTVKTLMRYIENQSICKTKFQRKLKWTLKPTQSRCANMRDYIVFLYHTKHSLQPLAFGKSIVKSKTRLENIDGNNRINAIFRFMQQPFLLFDEYLEKWESLVGNHCVGLPETDRTLLSQWFLQLSYPQLASKQTFKSLYKKTEAVRAVMEKLHVTAIDVLAEYYNTVHEALLLPNGQSFDQGVTVLVNLFEDATVNDLNDLFQAMNKYNGTLAVNDLLASRLFGVVVTLHDHAPVHNTGIRQAVQQYYDQKGQHEVLHSFRIAPQELYTFELNGFDFLVGLQNYAATQYPLTIHPIDSNSKGLPSLSRLFATLYGDLSAESMQPAQVAEFVDTTLHVCRLLKAAFDQLLPGQVNDALFQTTAQRARMLLPERPLYLVFCFVLGLLKQEQKEEKEGKEPKEQKEQVLLRHLMRLLSYNFLTKAVVCTKTRDTFAVDDKIANTVSESTTIGHHVLANPLRLVEGITKERMHALLQHLVTQRDDKEDPDNKPREKERRRRRKWTTTERLLTSVYYARKVPVQFLDKEFSVEHMVPFSSVWALGQPAGNLERLGNLVPFLLAPNRTRGNRAIDFYYETCPDYVKYLDTLLPTVEMYRGMVSFRDHQCQIPLVHDARAYDAFCERNEQEYIRMFLDHVGF